LTYANQNYKIFQILECLIALYTPQTWSLYMWPSLNIRAVELTRVKELIAIKKISTIKKLTHIHKFVAAGVPICKRTAVIWRSNYIQLI